MLSIRLLPAAVSRWIWSTAVRAAGESGSRLPITLTVAPCRRSSSPSRATYSSSSCIRASISSAGRCQFSWLNANRERTSTPASRHPATHSRTEAIPAWWPAERESPRWRAQRPFPSMITAMCRGVEEALTPP